MASRAQIAANRRNALKSTGPKTAEGKGAVGQNALRHGLCAERVVVLDESPADYAAFAAGLHAALAPVDDYEAALAERIVQCEWRLRRVWRMEAAAIDEEATSQGRARARLVAADTLAAELRENHSAAAARKAAEDVAAGMSDDELRAYADPAPDGAVWADRLSALSRYEAALERQLHRAALALERRQAERRAAAQPAPQPRAAARAAQKLPPPPPRIAPPAFAIADATKQSQFVGAAPARPTPLPAALAP